jgi:predicted deacetylase
LAVHVSIHDVAPSTAAEVEAALGLCRAAGVRPALLVVPDFHGRSPLLSDPALCARLRFLQADGHEIYLHGYSHRGGGAPPRPPAGRLAWMVSQRVVSAADAELGVLDASEGLARLERGEAVLAQAGLRIDGFVAPAWWMPRWLLPLLAARGYRFTEDHTRVYDPASGRARASVVLNWATRSPARVVSTIAWCRVAKRARALVPARIAIHPGDMRFLAVRREVETMLAWARGDFVARGVDLLGGPCAARC